jgi:pimeloyl-ACP methyl ester carboxylesterase
LADHVMHMRTFRISRHGAPTLNLRETGSGEPTFLLIHGFGEGGFVWDAFLPQLASLGRTFTIDLRGHGDSDWDADSRYSSAAHLDDVNFVIDALDLKKVILIGHSLGGEIAIRFSARRPERVAGLIVVDFGPELDRAASAHIRKEFVAESRVYADHDEYAVHLEAKQPLISPELRGTVAKRALRPAAQGGFQLKRDPAMGAAGLLNADALPALWPMLRDIRSPVLIIRGVASALLRQSVADRMVDVLPDGCLASVKLAGHAVMTDNPDDFAAAALSFIARRLKLDSPTRSEPNREMT